MNCVLLGLGMLCLGYYLVCGLSVRFGISLLWIWLALGLILIGRACAGIFLGFREPIWLRWTLGVGLALALGVFIVIERPILSHMNDRCPPDMDYLLVLGAKVNGEEPSPALQYRIDLARDYLEKNPRTVAVLSGGQGSDEDISEAECMRRALLSSGVAPERLIMEDQSTSTAENLRFSLALLPEEGQKVGIVTNNFHVYRALQLARHLSGHEFYGQATQFSLWMLPHYLVRECAAVIAETLRGNL